MVRFRKKKKSFADLNPIEASFMKLYTEEEMDIIKNHDIEKLKLLVSETDAHVMKAKKEMESNPEFIEAKERMDTFRGAFNDTKKYALAKKNLCLLMLQKRGVVDCGVDEEY